MSSTQIPLTPNLLARAVNVAADGIYIADRDGRIVFANQAILDIVGYRYDEFVGQRTSIFKSGRMSNEYYARLWRTVLSGRVWRELITNRRADGSVYEATQTITPISGDDGKIEMMIAVQRDITRQEELERELHNSQTEVERLLSEKETLLREVYHRVKNDMELSGSLLRLQAEDSQSDEARDALEQAAQRARALGQMYTFMEEQADSESVSAVELLARLTESLRAHTLPAEVEIGLDVSNIPLSSRMATAVSILVNELGVNAAKYGLKGVAMPRLRIRLREEDHGYISLTVSDNGTGFPDRVVRDETLGFGLGICRALARQYRGELRFENQDGARVTARLMQSG